MSADFDRVVKRVVEILNAGDAGSFAGTLSPRNKTRNLDAIKAAIMEAGLTIAQTLASVPSEYRAAFFQAPVAILHGAQIPAHLGKPVSIEIQCYAGAPFIEGRQRNHEKIESYRSDNLNLYSEYAHDEEGSPLSGFFDIWNEQFYFTGNAARITVANAARTDVYNASSPSGTPSAKIPDFFEPTWVKLSVPNCVKVGEGATVIAIADRYYSQGMADLQEFKTGKRIFAEVDKPAPAAEVHQL